jgi:hypothetical protein
MDWDKQYLIKSVELFQKSGVQLRRNRRVVQRPVATQT